MALHMSFNTMGSNKIVHDIESPFPYRQNLSLVLKLMHDLKRFNGTANFSVLQHTLLGVYLLPQLTEKESNHYPEHLKEWLFHDMHEIILNDIPSPVKQLIRNVTKKPKSDLDLLEDLLKNEVDNAFNLKNNHWQAIKLIDKTCYEAEAIYFMKTLDLPQSTRTLGDDIRAEISRIVRLSFEELEREFLTHLALINL